MSLIAFISDEAIIPYENIDLVDIDGKTIIVRVQQKVSVTLYKENVRNDFIDGYKKYLKFVQVMTVGDFGGQK